MATANPAMNVAVYQRAGQALSASTAMTVQGTVIKSFILLAILLATGAYSWTQAMAGTGQMWVTIGGIGGLVVALITIFFPKASPITAPLYAALEGLLLGGVSALFENAYQGIVFQAMGLSVATLAMMLFLYGTRIIRATERFKMGVFAATGAIALVYLVGMVLSLFGAGIPYIHESGVVGIGFSLVVVVVAALNLVLDFDFIERGAAEQAPKYMEWYGGFGLMVTLVWMYLEILRLLSKLRSRD